MSQIAVSRARLMRPRSMLEMWLVPMLPTPMTPIRTSVSFFALACFFMEGVCCVVARAGRAERGP